MLPDRLLTPQSEQIRFASQQLLREKRSSLSVFGESVLGIFADQGFRISPAIGFPKPKTRTPIVLGTTSTPTSEQAYTLFCKRVGSKPWRDAYSEAFPGRKTPPHLWAMNFVDKLITDPQTHVIFLITPEIFNRRLDGQSNISQQEILFLLERLTKLDNPLQQQILRDKVDFVLGF